eukprot:4261794-Prymnesium_polylepis.1
MPGMTMSPRPSIEHGTGFTPSACGAAVREGAAMGALWVVAGERARAGRDVHVRGVARRGARLGKEDLDGCVDALGDRHHHL